MECISFEFRRQYANLLPEDTGMDLKVFLDFGNLWGVDFDSATIVMKLDLPQVLALIGNHL